LKKCPFCGKNVNGLEEVDIEYLPSQDVLRGFVEERFHRKPSSVMYCCSKCSREIWSHYRCHVKTPKRIEGIYLI